jgi:N-acetylglucosaminyldiphosphoundecaprenol N-acetyl-beta-D-mannosaminyltransferase
MIDGVVAPASDPGAVTVLGVAVDHVDNEDVLQRIDGWVREAWPRKCRQICTVNPEFLVDARRDVAFRRVLEEADLRVADGVGVMLAARALGAPLPERVTGSDGIVRIAERAAQRGWRLFLLGASPGVAERAAARLEGEYPGLQVSGCHSGTPSAREWPVIVRRLRVAPPDVLLVAFGHPRQDFWIWTHRADLPCAVAIGVGGALDYAAGEQVRAPQWMRNLGLEWLHRLVTQPWRWRRMLKLPVFVWLLARQMLGARS